MASIKKEIASGVMYIAIAKYSGIIVNIFISAILARLLVPEDFGLIAIVSVFMNFFFIIGDIGIAPAIVQKRELSESDLDHIFSFTIYMGLALSSIFFFLSWIIANIYNDSRLVPISQLMGLIFFSNCARIVPSGLLNRAKRFKFTAMTGFSLGILTSIIAIFMAYVGMGVYALIIPGLINNFLVFIIYLYQYPRHFHFKLDTSPLKAIFSYSSFIFMFNCINYFSRNLDKMLVGKYLDFTQLGYYEKSYSLMMMPLQNITFVITPVLHPIFSQYQNDLKFVYDKYLELLSVLAYISFPLSSLCYFIAPELIQIIYGSQWQPAIAPFQILALTLGQQILISTTGSIYQAVNGTKLLFIGGCICAFLMISGFTISIFGWGTVTAVAWGFFVAQTLNSFQSYYLIFVRLLHGSLQPFVKKMMMPLFISVLVFIILFIYNNHSVTNNLFLNLIVKTAIALFVWGLSIQLFSPFSLKSILYNIAHRKFV